MSLLPCPRGHFVTDKYVQHAIDDNDNIIVSLYDDLHTISIVHAKKIEYAAVLHIEIIIKYQQSVTHIEIL